MPCKKTSVFLSSGSALGPLQAGLSIHSGEKEETMLAVNFFFFLPTPLPMTSRNIRSWQLRPPDLKQADSGGGGGGAGLLDRLS